MHDQDALASLRRSIQSRYVRRRACQRLEGAFMISTAAALVLVFLFAVQDACAEAIRSAVPRASLNYLSIYIAEAKGFFKDEGLENETIVIGGPAAIAALVSGNVDFSGAGGSGLRAAVKGAELKAIMYQTEKVTWYFVVHPSIKQVSDLKGKKVGVGLIGDSEDRFSTMFVERGGLSSKDITRIPMGTSSGARIAAIKSGSMHAAVLDPGGMIVAEKEGLHSLGFLGDLFPLPFQGYVVTDKKIAENPGQVRRWVRAMVRALMFLRDRPEEAAEVGIKKLQLGNIDRAMLIAATKAYTQAFAPGVPGLPSSEGIKNILEYEIREPMKMAAPPAAQRMFNFRFVEEVKKELEQQRSSR
jgi:ABC-type nitrate/sulfonate/bicarbonate transport system substrate-binding protein